MFVSPFLTLKVPKTRGSTAGLSTQPPSLCPRTKKPVPVGFFVMTIAVFYCP